MAQRRPISAGNWKMHLSDAAADELCRALLAGGIDRVAGVQVVLAPGFLQLGRVRGHFARAEGGVGVAGQNMHARDEGAFTGEVSPAQLVEQADWVILGHSERRQYFCEDDGALRAKVAAALSHGLRPILCVGETVEERDAGRTAAVLTRQVGQALEGVDLPEDFVIAYEPVWAIGSGRAATTEQAQEAAARIRDFVRGQAGDAVAQGCRILYGGSVKPANAGDFAAQPDIDGALVGGASLDAAAFLAITRAIAGA